jgi:hypothetical protein
MLSDSTHRKISQIEREKKGMSFRSQALDVFILDSKVNVGKLSIEKGERLRPY